MLVIMCLAKPDSHHCKVERIMPIMVAQCQPKYTIMTVLGRCILSKGIKYTPPAPLYEPKFSGNGARKTAKRNKSGKCIMCQMALPIGKRNTARYCTSCMRVRRRDCYKRRSEKLRLIPKAKICGRCGTTYEFLKSTHRFSDICLPCLREFELNVRHRTCLYCNKSINVNGTIKTDTYCDKICSGKAWYYLKGLQR